MDSAGSVAIIGAGPAGLMAAEVLVEAGLRVDIYDAMPTFGRKFLMAGKSGLNITHAEAEAQFLARYICPDPRLVETVRAFGASEVIDWMRSLGVESHTGPTERVFPNMMKASSLLRAWLQRLEAGGAKFRSRHRWSGRSDEGELIFETRDGQVYTRPDATVFALGGGSWRRLGSDGAWATPFQKAGVDVAPFQPSNGGFLVDWSAHFRERWAGAPLKDVKLSIGAYSSRGEFVVTQRGVESGGIYMLSAAIRDALAASGEVDLIVDLLPNTEAKVLLERLSTPRGKQSLSNHLRKRAKLSDVKRALVYEFASKEDLADPARLARLIKALPIRIAGSVPLDEAISTAGGVRWAQLTDGLMLKEKPGVFCAGEMLDWDAPTGGYLITACVATGRAAGQGVLGYLGLCTTG